MHSTSTIAVYVALVVDVVACSYSTCLCLFTFINFINIALDTFALMGLDD